jgi:pimeloyl-ACP methyl ester carboxylesterase
MLTSLETQLKLFSSSLGLICALVILTVGIAAQAQTFESRALAHHSSQPVVVLVPGFFNTAVPGDIKPSDGYIPYFSQAIIETIRARATVVVVDSLLPVGTVETNGVLLERFLAATIDRFPGRKLIVIAHSAGGLYLMRALTNRPELPIKTVVTIATPYTGIEFIDRLTNSVPGLDSLAHYLNLDSLREFRESNMGNVLKRFSVPDHIRWVTISGHQPACFLWTCGDSRYLSWLLSITQHLMRHSSDGIVTVPSALGSEVKIRAQSGQTFKLEPWADFNFALEHWEMVEDYRYFHALGVLDVGNIRDRQTRFFDAILDRLGSVELSGNIEPFGS